MKRVPNSDKVTVRTHRTPVKSVVTPVRSVKEIVTVNLPRSATKVREPVGLQFSERKRVGLYDVDASVKKNVDEKRQKIMGSTIAKERVERRKGNKFLFGRHGDLHQVKEDYVAQKSYNAMEERCNCTLEQLEATEVELNELRDALQEYARKNDQLQSDVEKYQKTISSLNMTLSKYREEERLRNLSASLASNAANEDKENIPLHSKEVCVQLRRLQEENGNLIEDNANLLKKVKKLEEEVNEAWHNNESLNAAIEGERLEWESLKADLLVAVKVANDFKVEAQEEKQALLAKIIELQHRRLSTSSLTTTKNAKQFGTPSPGQTNSWEDVALEKLYKEPTSGTNPTRFSALLQWCRSTLRKNCDLEITNFSSSWRDGRALCYLFAAFFPEKVVLKKIDSLTSAERLQLAFDIGREVGLKRDIAVEDILNTDRPPWSLLMPYILNVYYIVSS